MLVSLAWDKYPLNDIKTLLEANITHHETVA